jgi:hypothetical protein
MGELVFLVAANMHCHATLRTLLYALLYTVVQCSFTGVRSLSPLFVVVLTSESALLIKFVVQGSPLICRFGQLNVEDPLMRAAHVFGCTRKGATSLLRR